MGIISECVKCKNCKATYRLRFNVGNKYPQSSTFHCDTCGEDLTFGFTESESILINISKIPFNMDLTVVNLHPELTLEANLKSDPRYSPSLEFMRRQGQDGLDTFLAAQQCCILYQTNWDAIHKDFRYLKERRWKLLEQKYGNDEQITEQKIFTEVFEVADYFLQGKWAILADKMMDVVGVAHKHPKYEELRSYLLGFKEDFLLNKLYTAMTKYREVEAELLPTLLHQKCGIVPDGLSSTVRWEKIEKVYGDFFEIYGDLLLIPTTLNNLLRRNDFKKFNSEDFNLTKYLDIDKSGKAKNLESNSDLIPLCEYFKSNIRNGTHHQASTFDKESQNIEFKTGKGGRGRESMTLVSYIEHCNEIYARILIVLKTYCLIKMVEPSKSSSSLM